MRPLARNYLQHGSRHLATGSDPIPGIGQIPFASLRTNSGATITMGGTIEYISMHGGTNASFETSDSDTFVNALGTGAATAAYGIKCLENGTYMITENYFVLGGTGGATFSTYHTINGGDVISSWQPGRTGALVGDKWDAGSGSVHTFFSELVDATDAAPAPVYINPYASLATGSSVVVSAEMFVMYLGPYAGGSI